MSLWVPDHPAPQGALCRCPASSSQIPWMGRNRGRVICFPAEVRQKSELVGPVDRRLRSDGTAKQPYSLARWDPQQSHWLGCLLLHMLQEAQDQLTEAVRCAEKTQDHVQKLEIENAELQTTVKKQAARIEQLQKNLLSTRLSEDEKEQLKKYIELKQSLENSLDQEKKKNSELEKETTGLMILQQSWKLHLLNVCTWMQKIKFFKRSYYL